MGSCIKVVVNTVAVYKHPKRGMSWIEKSANCLELSAKRLAENAQTIKLTLFAELTLSFPPSHVQSMLKPEI